MFGYDDAAFPGRAVLEGLGAGLDVPMGVATTFAALRTSRMIDDKIWITGRATVDDADHAGALLAELAPVLEKHSAYVQRIGPGEALLQLPGHTHGDVTDSDPFVEDFHPWLRVLATDLGATRLANHMNSLLLDVREHLVESPVNLQRRNAGRPPLDVMTTKWSGVRANIPGFAEHTGVAGAAVTSTRLYRGLAELLGMAHEHRPPSPGPSASLAVDIANRILAAERLIARGARFVHVHIKATDVAGHTKNPRAKLKVLERLDPGLAGLDSLADRVVVAITGDHATPSVDGALHTADPTPLLVAGPTVRADIVAEFGERFARHGWFGTVRSHELLPLLFGHANRPVLHPATPHRIPALPDHPQPMPLR
jgi:2,3-bisphosphoglycerate-independent phosphoglycerate mutase